MGKIICGPCGAQFDEMQTYYEHVCPSSNTTPTDPAYLGPQFPNVQKAALERGAAVKQAEEQPAPEQQPPAQ